MGDVYMEYVEKVPKEARLANDALSGQNEIRWAVVSALIEKGALPFSELESVLEIHQQRLSNALDELQVGGLIKKRTIKNTGDKYAGYYDITEFGKNILDGFYEATRPKFEPVNKEPQLREVNNIKGASISGYNTSVSEVDVTEMERKPPASKGFNDVDMSEA
jgi:DNA-binding HxlR family transcriptional regulator